MVENTILVHSSYTESSQNFLLYSLSIVGIQVPKGSCGIMDSFAVCACVGACVGACECLSVCVLFPNFGSLQGGAKCRAPSQRWGN